MAKIMKKYKMKDGEDYRPDVNDHNILLVLRVDDDEWAYGEFTVIDDDMLDITEEELAMIPKKEIPIITSRQCKEMLIITGRYNTVISILDGLPDTTEVEKTEKLIMKNYWDNSQEFIRDHQYMEMITNALGMSSDEVDDFFIAASKR